MIIPCEFKTKHKIKILMLNNIVTSKSTTLPPSYISQKSANILDENYLLFQVIGFIIEYLCI